MSESDDEVGFTLPVFTSEDGEQVNIDSNSKNNKLDNLKTLCRSCFNKLRKRVNGHFVKS